MNGALRTREANKETTSILSENERRNLANLSCMASEARELSVSGSFFDLRDRNTLREAVTWPSALICRRLAPFALDLISCYKDLVTKPGDWTRTLPGYWASTHQSTETPSQAIELMQSLELLIRYVSSSHDVKMVLMKAFESTSTEMQLVIPRPGEVFYPTRDGYEELGNRLCPGTFETNAWNTPWSSAREHRDTGDCSCSRLGGWCGSSQVKNP